MKFNYLWYCFLCLFPILTQAQEGLKLGAQFTPTFSTSTNAEDAAKGNTLVANPAFSYNTGIYAGYGISEIVSISTGVHYVLHQNEFSHQRMTLSSGAADPNFGKHINRSSQFVRIPLLFEICTDPNRILGLFFRLGPHFDFLLDANYTDERLIGFSNYDHTIGLDLTQSITLYEPNRNTGGIISKGRAGKIYSDLMVGLTINMGAQIRINDQFKLVGLFHIEASSNPEDEGAASLAHNLNRGDHLITANPVSNPTAAMTDNNKVQAEETPFDAIFPNYIEQENANISFRSPTWHLAWGIQVGIIYTYDPSR